MFSKPSYPLIGAMLAALAAIALAAYVAWQVTRPMPIATVGSSSVAVPSLIKIGGPFTLTDHQGNRVSDEAYRGKLMLIYFGYGYCPDVCPTELQNMAVALDEMGEAGAEVLPIFITIDPERDTVEFMAEYVANFHSRMIGLTGSRDEVDAAATLYRVYHAKVNSGSDSDYFVDHSSLVYLMGRDGNFLTVFRGATDPQKIAKTIADYL
jgi:cytochrome oxidase Cu insertion factor (SCO1/SenC/PrrC family)